MPNLWPCFDATYFAYRGTCAQCNKRRLIRAFHAVRLATHKGNLCGPCDTADHAEREQVRNMMNDYAAAMIRYESTTTSEVPFNPARFDRFVKGVPLNYAT